MGKDYRFNEENQPEEQAHFIKIWDFMSLVEGTEIGCKYRTRSLFFALTRLTLILIVSD